jgi:WD40 repeat protein
MNHEQSLYHFSAQNQEALQTLQRALRLSEGLFSLILARCNYAQLRSSVVEQLQSQAVSFCLIQLPTSVKQLYTPIKEQIGDEQPPALMVFGLESVQALDELLSATNLVRDEFRQTFHFPIVLWVNDEVLQKLIRLAPDFETYATALEFSLTPDELLKFIQGQTEQVFAQVLAAGSHPFMPNAMMVESQASSELQFAQKDLKQQGVELTSALAASVQFILGRECYAGDRIESALLHYQTSLSLWQEALAQEYAQLHPAAIVLTPHPASIAYETLTPKLSHYLIWQGVVWFHIGLCQRRQAELSRLHTHSYLQDAKVSLHHCIETLETAKRPDLVAQYITQQGEVLRDLQAWDQLAKVAKKSLQLHQNEGNLLQLAQDYSFLAEVALHHSRAYEAALADAGVALETLSKVPVADNLYLKSLKSQQGGLYRLLLAQALSRLGRMDEAVYQLETARQSTEAQLSPPLYLQILKWLRSLYFQQGQYEKAFNIKQERRAVEAQYGFRAFVGAGRLQPHRHATNPALTPLPMTPTLPSEFTASGREEDINRLLNRIRSTQYKLTVIHGQSGVGKSSLVTAGLVPALNQTPIETREVVSIVLQVYTDWVSVLGNTLVQALNVIKARRAEAITPLHQLASLPAVIEQLKKNVEQNLFTVFIFDQFEEFFFVCREPEKRQEFFEFFGELLNLPFVKVILALRDDYLHFLLQCSRQINLETINNDILSKEILYYLGNFSQNDAERVIKNLTDRAQFYLEDALVEELVDDLAGEMGEVRPIELQIVGAQLQAQNITTLAQYQKDGPKHKLVERFLEEVVKDCGPENQRAAKLLLYFLTQENETRPLKTKAELIQDLEKFEEENHIDLVLDILVKSGLISRVKEGLAVNEASPQAVLYQLVHDYLVTFIRASQEVDVLEAEELRKQNKKLLKDKELNEQLKQSQAQQQQMRRRLDRVLKSVLAGAITAAIGLGGLAWLAATQKQRAEIAEIEARNSESKALRLSDDQLGALVASVKAGTKLLQTKAPKDVEMLTAERLQQAVANTQERNRLEGHTNSVVEVSFSPDGQTIASASVDGTVKLWSREGALLKTLTGHESAVTSVSFSPTGELIATASADNMIKLWQTDGRLISTLKEHQLPVTRATFSPNGQLLASASADNTIKLWYSDGRLIRTLQGHENWVLDVAFSPDGQTIASASRDGTVKLWNLSGKTLKTLSGPVGAGFTSVTFSPDGQTIAAASTDKNTDPQPLGVMGLNNTIQLWSRQGEKLLTLRQSDWVLSVSFSPDSQTIASASRDGTVQLWNREDGQLRKTLTGHGSGVRSVRFSPDGEMIASASEDKTVKLWSLENSLVSVLKGHTDRVTSVSFSPNGQKIASASADKTVILWNNQGRQLQTLIGHKDWVSSVSFSPDGQMLASASADKTLILWSQEGEQLQTLTGHTDRVTSVSWHPDSKLLASAGLDKTVRLWSRQGKLLKTLQGHSDRVTSVAFSPNAQMIASASADKTVKLWNLEGQLLNTLQGHSDRITSVAFSPDSQQIASASADKTVKLWTVDGKLVKTLPGHSDRVTSVAFSSDGQMIASVGDDQTILLWNLNGQEPKTLQGHNARITSVSFSPNSQTLATGGEDNTVILWNLELEFRELLGRSCTWLHDYLKTNPSVQAGERNLCEGVVRF